MARKPTELRPIMTRVPEGLRRKLEREAKRNDRSMNAEIIHRLEQSFRPSPLDLFAMLRNALDDGASRFGKGDSLALLYVVDPIKAALVQLLPNLYSVQITLIVNDGSPSSTATSYSDRGWEMKTGEEP